MDITKLKGEELAEMISKQYELLFQAQNNLRAIQDELTRRKEQQDNKVDKKK